MKKIVLSQEELIKLKELNEQGYVDTEIGKILGYSRKIIGKFRKELHLPSYKEESPIKVQKIRELANQGMGIHKIAKTIKSSIPVVHRICDKYNIQIKFQFTITPELEKQILNLYSEGKMDSEIEKEIGVSSKTVCYYRKSHNLPTKFNYSKISKINNEEFEKLFNQGLSDYKIAKILGMSSDGVYSHRMRHGYFRESLSENKPIELSSFQKQVLLGTILGDSSFKMGKDSKNPAITCAHCIKQKEYCEYKTKIFENLGSNCVYRKRKTPSKKTGKIYNSYTMFVPANPTLKSWYYSFYKDKIKIIPFDLFEYFTEVSLAFMYMDDGYKTQCSYGIATNCFTIEELNKFRIFLLEKFNLETSIHKGNRLYILAKSAKRFTELISPYICNCMKYKLQSL